MNDQGIEAGTFLCFEDFCDGFRVERIRGKAINGFGGQRDDLAFLQKRDGSFRRLCALPCRSDFSFHFGGGSASTLSVCFFRKASRFLRILSLCRPIMLAASSAAFFAPAEPIARVPTGIPPGIWAMDRSESKPCSAFD